MEVKGKMYNVLVFGMTENPGGIETVIMDYYRELQDKKIHFDFLCNTKKEIAYEKDIKKRTVKYIRLLLVVKIFINTIENCFLFLRNMRLNMIVYGLM